MSTSTVVTPEAKTRSATARKSWARIPLPSEDVDRELQLAGIKIIPTEQVRREKKKILQKEFSHRRIPRWWNAKLHSTVDTIAVIGVLFGAVGIIAGLLFGLADLLYAASGHRLLMDALTVVGAFAICVTSALIGSQTSTVRVPYWERLPYSRFMRRAGEHAVPKGIRDDTTEIMMRLPSAEIEIERLAYTQDPYIRVRYAGATRYFGHWDID